LFKAKNVRNLVLLLILTVVVLVVHRFASARFMENIYGNGIFPKIRWLLDYTFGSLPFSGFYFLIGLVLSLAFFYLRKAFRRGWKTLLFQFITGTLQLACLIVIFFYVLWGFNYDRFRLIEKMNFEGQAYSDSLLLKYVEQQIDQLNTLSETELKVYDFHFPEIEKEIRSEAVSIAQKYGYTTSGKVQCRQLLPKGVLMRIGTAGFYSPLTGECNIDAGLHPAEKPFVMAHVFFHGLGVGGEGECNFLAYLLCHASAHPLIQYSGELEFWRYISRDLYRMDKEMYLDYLKQISPAVRDHLIEIRENGKVFLFPVLVCFRFIVLGRTLNEYSGKEIYIPFNPSIKLSRQHTETLERGMLIFIISY